MPLKPRPQPPYRPYAGMTSVEQETQHKALLLGDAHDELGEILAELSGHFEAEGRDDQQYYLEALQGRLTVLYEHVGGVA